VPGVAVRCFNRAHAILVAVDNFLGKRMDGARTFGLFGVLVSAKLDLTAHTSLFDLLVLNKILDGAVWQVCCVVIVGDFNQTIVGLERHDKIAVTGLSVTADCRWLGVQRLSGVIFVVLPMFDPASRAIGELLEQRLADVVGVDDRLIAAWMRFALGI